MSHTQSDFEKWLDGYHREHGRTPTQQNVWNAARATAPTVPVDTGLRDAYEGAREDLAIWKKQALEAEALNRKLIADINGPTFMGEPLMNATQETLQQVSERLENIIAAGNIPMPDSLRVMALSRCIESLKTYIDAELADVEQSKS